MASAIYGQRFRLAVGDPGGANPVFSNEEIDLFFAEAEEFYPDAGGQVHLAYAVIMGLNALRAKYATQVSYSANAASENLSDITKNYDRMIADWKAKLEEALKDTVVGIHWGSTSKTPTRIEEYPDA